MKPNVDEKKLNHLQAMIGKFMLQNIKTNV